MCYVVWTDEWRSSNWICSGSPPAALRNLAAPNTFVQLTGFFSVSFFSTLLNIWKDQYFDYSEDHNRNATQRGLDY
jgi:hypothetical protein